MARDYTFSTANYLDIGDVAAIDITGTALTVCAWVRPNVNNTTMGVVAKTNNAATTVQYYLGMSTTGKVEIQIGDATTFDIVDGATTITTSVWHHIALLKNGTGAGALQAFLDGVSDGSATSNRTIQNTAQSLVIGRESDAFYPFDGRIAEVAIWDVALTATQIAALATGINPLEIAPGNLKGYWPLWGAGSPEADLSGNANNATINGTVNAANHSPAAEYVPDNAGYAASFLNLVTATLSCTATNVTTVTTKLSGRLLTTTATGIASVVRLPTKVLTAIAVSVPKKVVQLSRTYTVVGTSVTTLLRTFLRTVSSVGGNLASLCNTRFGASSQSTIEVSNRWSLSEDFTGFSLEIANKYSFNIDLEC